MSLNTVLESLNIVHILKKKEISGRQLLLLLNAKDYLKRMHI
jgi:hypothetical protein